jgi:hypothetical protein
MVMITSVESLFGEAVFDRLARAQSLYDEEDVRAKSAPCTRSPYHAVAFLIAYIAADARQREQIVAQHHAKIERLGKERAGYLQFDKNALETLISRIRWKSLLTLQEGEALPFTEAMREELGGPLPSGVEGSDPSMLSDEELLPRVCEDVPPPRVVPLGFGIKIRVPDKTAFLTAVSAYCPELAECLDGSACRISLEKGPADTLSLIHI